MFTLSEINSLKFFISALPATTGFANRFIWGLRATDGMSPAAVKAYRRENPGSKLKTAVTGDPKPGSKDAKRRKSFCARSKGQQDMHNISCSKTPDKPVCKARRRWKC